MDIQLPDHLFGYITIDTETKDMGLQAGRGPGCAFQGEDVGGRVAGISVHADNFHEYLPIGHESGNMDKDKVLRWCNAMFANETQPKIFANASYDIGWLRREGVLVKGPIHDVQLQAPLLDEHRFSYSLENLAIDELGVDMGKDIDILRDEYKKLGLGTRKKSQAAIDQEVFANLWRFDPKQVAIYANKDTFLTRGIFDKLMPKIYEEELGKVYELECDLIPLLIEMRWRGVRMDLDRAQQKSDEFQTRENALVNEISKFAGFPVTITKPADIVKILQAEGVKMPKTATGRDSVPADFLEEIAPQLPIAEKIVKARQLNKARKTFIESYIFGHQVNGRLHTTFNQLRADKESGVGSKGTVSGRFSSDSPNLQNIPNPEKDPDLAKEIRSMFLPEEGCVWAIHDFSQQEPRGMVAMAWRLQQMGMKVRGADIAAQRYIDDPKTDFHTMTATMMTPNWDELSPDEKKARRKSSKEIGLGLAYGMGGGKLAFKLGLPYYIEKFKGKDVMKPGPEAQRLLREFDNGVPFIGDLAKICKELAKTRGFIKTPLGRRSRFPFVEIKNSAGVVIGKERFHLSKALNALIQPMAADEIKLAMRDLWREGIVPALTVHDEIDRTDVESAADCKRSVEIMLAAMPKGVPSKVDLECGANWGDAVLPPK